MAISEAQVENSLEWLNLNAHAIGKAKARVYMLQEGRKSIKATLMNDCPEPAANAKEIYAYSHKDYKDYLKTVGGAIEQFDTLKVQQDYHAAILDSWRTMEASKRILGKFQ